MAKYRVEAEFTYWGYVDVDAESEEEAWDIAEDIDGGDFEEMPGTWKFELHRPELVRESV